MVPPTRSCAARNVVTCEHGFSARFILTMDCINDTRKTRYGFVCSAGAWLGLLSDRPAGPAGRLRLRSSRPAPARPPLAPVPEYGVGDSYQFSDGATESVITIDRDTVQWRGNDGISVNVTRCAAAAPRLVGYDGARRTSHRHCHSVAVSAATRQERGVRGHTDGSPAGSQDPGYGARGLAMRRAGHCACGHACRRVQHLAG